MPINTQLESFGLRQASERLHQDRLRRQERRGELGLTTDTGTTTTGAGERPELPELPTFTAPEFDEGKVAAKTQKIAAPRIRQLREAVRTTQAQSFENPNVKRMTVGQALQGYGTGLESVISGARKGAVAEYGQEFQAEFSEAQINFQTELAGTMAQYGNLWTEFLTNLKGNLANQAGGGGGQGLRVEQNRPTPSRPITDPNDPGTIGGVPIYAGPGI